MSEEKIRKETKRRKKIKEETDRKQKVQVRQNEQSRDTLRFSNDLQLRRVESRLAKVAGAEPMAR